MGHCVEYKHRAINQRLKRNIEMQFHIAGDEQGTPSFEGVLERINVVLGTNGSGKSKLLDGIDLIAAEQETGFEVVSV